MAKWEQWIDDESEDDLELVEDYESFQPIRRKKTAEEGESSDFGKGKNKKKKKAP